jgi:hypothetical protein
MSPFGKVVTICAITALIASPVEGGRRRHRKPAAPAHPYTADVLRIHNGTVDQYSGEMVHWKESRSHDYGERVTFMFESAAPSPSTIQVVDYQFTDRATQQPKQWREITVFEGTQVRSPTCVATTDGADYGWSKCSDATIITAESLRQRLLAQSDMAEQEKRNPVHMNYQ